MSLFHLAQLNVARSLAPMDDALMAGFVGRLDEINALGERSPGFVWRLRDDTGNATNIRVTDDALMLVNLTVWESLEALFAFVYRSPHKELFARRFDWFERAAGPSVVLWWQPAGTLPTLEDAMQRLDLLSSRGPTPDAFTFKQPFDAPGAASSIA